MMSASVRNSSKYHNFYMLKCTKVALGYQQYSWTIIVWSFFCRFVPLPLGLWHACLWVPRGELEKKFKSISMTYSISTHSSDLFHSLWFLKSSESLNFRHFWGCPKGCLEPSMNYSSCLSSSSYYLESALIKPTSCCLCTRVGCQCRLHKWSGT